MLARSKLNRIENKISKALIKNEINHEGITTIVNEEKSYCELKENIRMMRSQRSYTEKNTLIKYDQRKGIAETIIQNEYL